MKYGYFRTGILLCAVFSSIVMHAVPRFHLKNNSGIPIVVDLYKDSDAKVPLDKIQVLYADLISENDEKVDQIKSMKISYCDTGKTCKKPDYYVTVSFDLGKIKSEAATYYLKFDIAKDGQGVVSAQKGSGLFEKKTTDGYSLKNNVRKINVIDGMALAR